jgi:hypothetical protein
MFSLLPSEEITQEENVIIIASGNAGIIAKEDESPAGLGNKG